MKIALAQLRSNLFETDTNLHRALNTISLASQKGADYVLFPELYISGYLLNESKIHSLSETIHGKSISVIKHYAQQNNIGVIIGFPEKEGESIFNTAIFINKSGKILGSYRKIHLYDHEKNIFVPGSYCPIFEVPEGTIGLMITYDMEFPEIARILALKGCKLLLVLTANMVPYQSYQTTYLKARAMENHVFVAAINKVGLENNAVFFGESEVIHPTGKTLYKSCNNEDLAFVEIDLSETEASKGLLNYLANRRPDIYIKEGL